MKLTILGFMGGYPAKGVGTTAYLLESENFRLLIDVGSNAILALERHLDPKLLDAVILTHYHPDHIGLVSKLMKQGIKLLVIDTQRTSIHYSDEIFRRDKRLNYEPIDEESITVISCEESREFLEGMGIFGEIISTPSHSKDSVSLILDNGVCFVGDLEPIEYLNAYKENAILKKDWELVMSHNPKMIYYAHANEKNCDE